jgi:hypothetical protein
MKLEAVGDEPRAPMFQVLNFKFQASLHFKWLFVSIAGQC